MSFAKLNKAAKTVADGIDTSKMEFVALKDQCGKEFILKGFFFTTGKYGREIVVVTDDVLINIPKRYVEQFEAIKADPDMLEALLDGKCKITNIKMGDTSNGKTVFFDFADVE
ncbi:MAG: hypothetical protein MJZ03_03985 [archaeon]|nr:hypothetical protein [archaeon]